MPPIPAFELASPPDQPQAQGVVTPFVSLQMLPPLVFPGNVLSSLPFFRQPEAGVGFAS
jgi:hypothetical protein